MIDVVGVKFRTAGKIYYFDPVGFEVEAGDNVVVETARGLEFGIVALVPTEVDESEIVQPLKKLIRKADEKDILRNEENQKKKGKAMQLCQEKITRHNMDMKLVDVEYTFDNTKVIFYFTSEGRVDFRDLVKDLAGVFRMRIELRQIGVRDEAKLLGGIGHCGKGLCCHE
jgi:cell fate regulator YaaT (PSP1 superfamily)